MIDELKVSTGTILVGTPSEVFQYIWTLSQEWTYQDTETRRFDVYLSINNQDTYEDPSDLDISINIQGTYPGYNNLGISFNNNTSESQYYTDSEHSCPDLR